jgi:hypothetical protein
VRTAAPASGSHLKQAPADTETFHVTRLRVRSNGPALAFAALGVWAMTFVALYSYGWNDYSTEVAPAYAALIAGHLGRFLALAPGYGGSLVLRAPFALIPSLWSGGSDDVYRAVSVPCLVAAALLGVWLVAQMRTLGHDRLARATALGLCVANPVTLYALQDGHAEELLGAVLCVAAVLAAQRGRGGLAALALGLAIANKQWALLAIGPVLLALPPGRRARPMVLAGALVLCIDLPLWLISGSGQASGGQGALAGSSAGTIFQPWQVWWFLGSHGQIVRDAFGAIKAGYRTPPAFLQTIDHPLIVVLGLALSALALRRRCTDAMLLLALLLALRFALDSWDTVYYPLPFIFALLAWECLERRRPPVLALSASVIVWLVFIVAPERLSPDAQSALFLLAALPTLAALATATFAPRARLMRALDGSPRRSSSAPSAAPISGT